MADVKRPTGFRILIIGGGVAGLTLANALQHAGIDYLLLESRPIIDPQVGASIGMSPNGIRILDQLSCYGDIEKEISPLESQGNHAANGDYLGPRSDTFKLVSARTSYPICFLERQKLLRILADHILDSSKILLNKRLSKVDHSAERVTAHCTDGTSYYGDIIAGADGVSSKVRHEMWRAADAVEPGYISEKEKDTLISEYRCLFGISSPTTGLPERGQDLTYMKDASTMTITMKGGRVFWSIYSRMPEIYRAGNIPRFTKADADEFARKNLDIPIMPQGALHFRDMWENRKFYALVALEEADYDHWTWGRFACLGDGVHKVTPNMGVGGMQAIESAAALANAVHALVIDHKQSHPSFSDVRKALTGYQNHRKVRTSEFIKVANYVTRIQALKSIGERIIAHYVMPNAGDHMVDMACDGWIGATILNYIPPPPRSLDGSMPFNPEQGFGKKESKLHRALAALPFVILAFWCYRIIMPLGSWGSGGGILRSGPIRWGEPTSIRILEKVNHWKRLENGYSGANVLMASSALSYDPIGSFQTVTFLADYGLVYAIILIESARRANMLTILQIPLMFGVLAMHGIGIVLPSYYLLHYIMTPIANFKAADLRLTNTSYTLSVLPVMIVVYYGPYLSAYLSPEPTTRHITMWLWHMFPVWATLSQWVLARTVIPSTIKHDRIHNVTRDLWPIRITVGTLAALSGYVWLHVLLSAPCSWSELFIPSREGLDSFVGSARNFLQYDHLVFAGSSLLWVVYLFSDLKRAGMVRQSWAGILGILAAVTAVFGPGAATAVGWIWREEILATAKHKGAVVRGRKGTQELNGHIQPGTHHNTAKV